MGEMKSACLVKCKLFNPGNILITKIALCLLNSDDVGQAIARHLKGDWGDVCAEDKKSNDFAVNNELRMLSAFKDREDNKFWIITEADRSYTTVLLPSEY
jgi:hypothetical protein